MCISVPSVINKYCICIMLRGRIYSEIQPDHEGNPEGGAQGISQGLRLYFTVYPDLSHITDILNFFFKKSSIVLPGRAILEELIFCIGLAAGAIFSRIAQYIKQYGSVQTQQRTHQERLVVRRAILEELNLNITLFQ